MPAEPRPINWAVVVDVSRSMRVPMVHEAQFRALAQHASVQETLLDGVPVWQFSRPPSATLLPAPRQPGSARRSPPCCGCDYTRRMHDVGV